LLDNEKRNPSRPGQRRARPLPRWQHPDEQTRTPAPAFATPSGFCCQPVLAPHRVRPSIDQASAKNKPCSLSRLGQVATVVAAVCSRLRAFVTRVMTRANATWRRLTRPLPMITGIANAVPRTRRELVAENALLRQQAIVASRKVKRPCWQSSLAMAPGPVATSTHRIVPRNDQLPGRCRLWRRCRGSMSSRFRATPGLGRAPATRACGRPTSRMQRCGPPRYADLALVKRFDADDRAVSRCVSSSRT
jgi:hypothetical protein